MNISARNIANTTTVASNPPTSPPTLPIRPLYRAAHPVHTAFVFYLTASAAIVYADARLPFYQKLLIGSVALLSTFAVLFARPRLQDLLLIATFVLIGFIGYILRDSHYLFWTMSGLTYIVALSCFWVLGRRLSYSIFSAARLKEVAFATIFGSLVSLGLTMTLHDGRAAPPSFLAAAVFVAGLVRFTNIRGLLVAAFGIAILLIVSYASGWRAVTLIIGSFLTGTVALVALRGLLRGQIRLIPFLSVGFALTGVMAVTLYALEESGRLAHFFASQILPRYEKLLDPYLLQIELAVRIQEAKDALRQFWESRNAFIYIFGYGHGATFDATTIRNMIGAHAEWWQNRFSESGDAHVIHFGLVRWLYRHGIVGLIIIVGGIILAARDWIKFAWALGEDGTYGSMAKAVGAGAVLMFAARGLVQPVEWDPTLWYALGLWAYGLQEAKRSWSNAGSRVASIRCVGRSDGGEPVWKRP